MNGFILLHLKTQDLQLHPKPSKFTIPLWIIIPPKKKHANFSWNWSTFPDPFKDITSFPLSEPTKSALTSLLSEPRNMPVCLGSIIPLPPVPTSRKPTGDTPENQLVTPEKGHYKPPLFWVPWQFFGGMYLLGTNVFTMTLERNSPHLHQVSPNHLPL